MEDCGTRKTGQEYGYDGEKFLQESRDNRERELEFAGNDIGREMEVTKKCTWLARLDKHKSQGVKNSRGEDGWH